MNYISKLKQEYQEELEQLVFFNPGQQSARDAIVDSLEKFGAPSIHTVDGYLRIKLEKLNDVQTLYALDGDKLAGLLIYSRVSHEYLTMIYIIVDQDYSSHGKFEQKKLVLRMIMLLRKIARRIKDVKYVKIIRGGNQVQNYPV